MKIKYHVKQLFNDCKICGFNVRHVMCRRDFRRKKKSAIIKLRKDMEEKVFKFMKDGKSLEALIYWHMTESKIRIIAAHPLTSKFDPQGFIVPVNRCNTTD